jgi:hypothetical protein
MTASPRVNELRKREMFDTLSHLQAEPTDVTYEETIVGDRPALWARPLNAVSGSPHGGDWLLTLAVPRLEL